MEYELAQVNIARLVAPLDSAQLADFVGALDAVNADAENAAGFVWRLADESGNATAIPAFAWDACDSEGVIVNLSVWASVEALKEYIYGGRHVEVLRRRREWFHKVDVATTALWWVPAGHRPSTAEAEQSLHTCGDTDPRPAPSPCGRSSCRPAPPCRSAAPTANAPRRVTPSGSAHVRYRPYP